MLVQIVGQAQFKRWCRLVGDELLFADPCFANDESRGENGDVLNDRMTAWCLERSNADVLEVLDRERIPASAMYSPQQVLDDPHIQAMGYCTAIDYPGLPRPAPIVETPFRLSQAPTTIRGRPPMIGEHTDRVLKDLGYDAAATRALRETSDLMHSLSRGCLLPPGRDRQAYRRNRVGSGWPDAGHVD